MGLTQNQQIFELLKKSSRTLILFRKNFSGDAIASALALLLILKKLDKKVDAVCENFHSPQSYSFLPHINEIKPNFGGLKKFIINLDLSDTKLKDFSYDIKGNNLNIYLTPEAGSLAEKNISFKSGNFKYDLIITLDTDDLESLGELYEKNTEFFFNTPTINIDSNPENEQYGQINLVELTKTSTAEIIFNLIEGYDINLLDQDIATCLLTGMIAKTKSFRTSNITPKTLNTASQLILNGAERDLIIQNLYRTKSISTLKLWGKVLSRLKHDPQYKLAWSYLQRKDFLELNVQNPNLSEVIEELITSAPEAEIIVLFYENQNKGVSVIIYTSKNYDSLYLAKNFNPTGTKTLAELQINKPELVEVVREVMESIKNNLK